MSMTNSKQGVWCHSGMIILTSILAAAGSAYPLRSQDIWTAQLMEKIQVGTLFWGEGYFMSESNSLRYSIDIGNSFPGQLTAKLMSDTSELSFGLIGGEPRTYSGCNLFNNSFMPPPKLRSVICLQSVDVIHYTGNLELPQSVKDDLKAGVLTLQLLSDTGRLIDGLIQRETPPSLSIQKSGSTNIVTWESDGRCTLAGC